LQVLAVGSSIVLRPGATRVAGTEPHAAKLPYESVVAAGDLASKCLSGNLPLKTLGF
jgi:hypothetical protein